MANWITLCFLQSCQIHYSISKSTTSINNNNYKLNNIFLKWNQHLCSNALTCFKLVFINQFPRSFLQFFTVWKERKRYELFPWENIHVPAEIPCNSVYSAYRSFSLSRSKKINRKPFSGLSQEIVNLLKINKEDTSPSFRSVRSPKP